MDEATTQRLLEEILAQLKEVNLHLMMLQVGLVGPEEAERIRRRATENPHDPLKDDPEKLPGGEVGPSGGAKRRPVPRAKSPFEGVSRGGWWRDE